MMPKFLLLFFATCLLVQSSFGKALPEQPVPNFSSDIVQEQFAHQFIHHVLKAVGQVTKGKDSIQEIAANLLKMVKLFSDGYNEYDTDKEHKSFLSPALRKKIDNHIPLILNRIYYNPRSENMEEISADKYETLSDKRLIFVAEQFRNLMDVIEKAGEDKIDADQAVAEIVNFYKESVKKYYNAMPKEEQERKKSYADYVEKLTSSDQEPEESENKLSEMISEFFDLSKSEEYKIQIVLEILGEKKTQAEVAEFVMYIKMYVENYKSIMNEESDVKESMTDFLNELNNIDYIDEQYLLIRDWIPAVFGVPKYLF